MAPRRISNQALLGALIVLIGVLLLVDTTGLYDVSGAFVYFPSLFVLLGAYALVTSGFRNVGGPLVLVVVAGAWQLAALDVFTAAQLAQFWPVLIIVLGLSIALGRLRPAAAEVDDSRVDPLAIFGGRNQRVTSKSFEGGDVTALFGGVELDLRDAAVADPPARINATVMFGGADLVVPRNWRIRLDVLPLFGAAEDERPRREEEHDEVDLVVTGFCAFGGISVKD